ncbi:MAG TPA: LysM peptidoglycan-binding domain-containing protein [Verrucomicrobiae bacterium]|jgi:chromosome segregation ATPase
MIKSSILILALAATAPFARAQDAATQQQLDKLSGQIQDITAALDVQNKRIGALEQKLSDLQDKLNQPGGNNFAGADDLKKLADQVQQIDQKRQSDNAQILKELERLEKSLNGSSSHIPDSSAATTTNSMPAVSPYATAPHYEYEIKAGDTIGAVAKAYVAQGIKVTTSEILKANPGLKPSNLHVGQKIIIPQPQ